MTNLAIKTCLMLISIDDEAMYEGEFQVLQRQMAEKAFATGMFFNLELHVHRQQHRCHESPILPARATF